MDNLTKELLILLENNNRLTTEQIGSMLKASPEEIAERIDQLEKEQIIVRYNTVINWEKAQVHRPTALIEVNITPQRGSGYDKVAERIYRFPQVKSLYLVSGTYDLCVIVEGDTMQEISNFVAEHLACLEEVRGTKTNFIMRSYKKDGVIFNDNTTDKRLVISL